MISKTTAALQSRPSIVTEERCKDTILISLVNQSPAKNCGLQVSNADSQMLRVTVGNAQTELTNLLIIPRTQNCVLRANNIGSQKGLAILVIAGYSSADFLASLRCLRWISPLAALTKKPAVLSPTSFSFSMSSSTSCGILIVVIFDLAFFEPVAITEFLLKWCISVYSKKRIKKALKCISLECSFKFIGEIHQCKDKARQCWNTYRASNHNHLSEVKDMAVIQHTQTHPKFTWRFMALSADGLDIVHIEAGTEEEARALSPAGHVIIFAGRFNEGDRYDN
ncbi:host cell division inhibitor Icd-like protein [Rosenbergiella epipactidis]